MSSEIGTDLKGTDFGASRKANSKGTLATPLRPLQYGISDFLFSFLNGRNYS